MQIQIQTQQLNLTEKQKEWIEKKVAHLGDLAARVSDESSHIRVDISHVQTKSADQAYECSLTLFVPQDTLRAEANAGSLENVLDEVLDKIRPQVEKYKHKVQGLDKRHQANL